MYMVFQTKKYFIRIQTILLTLTADTICPERGPQPLSPSSKRVHSSRTKATPIMGNAWAEIATRLMPHRDRGHIRKRFQVLQRRIPKVSLHSIFYHRSSSEHVYIVLSLIHYFFVPLSFSTGNDEDEYEVFET